MFSRIALLRCSAGRLVRNAPISVSGECKDGTHQRSCTRQPSFCRQKKGNNTVEPITDYHSTIHDWSIRFQQNPQCDLGSDLHADSLRYPIVEGGGNFDSGKMVVRALRTGVEVLSGILDMEEQQMSQGLSVPSLSVLSRTGMVSAALTIWLLESDEADTRLERGLLLARENIKQLKAFADRAEVFNKTVDPDMNRVATSLREQADTETSAIERVMAKHGFNSGRKVENSAILFQITEHLNSQDGDANDYRKTILDAWRKDSGFAHALAWQYDLAFDLPPHDFYDDVVAAPTILMGLAMELFDKRRKA